MLRSCYLCDSSIALNRHKVGIFTLYKNSISCLVPCDYEDVVPDCRTNLHVVKNNGSGEF